MRRTGWILVLSCLGSAAHAAGTVDVSFVHPETFADVKDASGFRDTNLKLLAADFEELGNRLSPAQTLKIEVLDVDLAGDVRPRGARGDIRVMKGGADWPRVKLRYSLQSGGQVTQSGEETVSDMSYLDRMRTAGSSEPLYYEKRMLDNWFTMRFVERRAATP